MLGQLSIKTKILSVIALLGVVSLCGLAYLSYQFSDVNRQYGAFIANDAKAGILGARSSAGMWTAVNAITRTALSKPGSPEFDEAQSAFTRNLAGANEKIVQIGTMVPERKPAADELVKISGQFKEIFDKIVAAKLAGKDDEALALVKKLDVLAPDFSTKSGNNNTALTQRLDDGGARLSAYSDSVMFGGIVGMLIGVAVTLALAFYVASAGITGPMAILRARMQSLVGGEVEQPIAGTERGDEIGAMARAVEVFRGNAQERAKLEREAAETRSMSESERNAREAQRQQQAAALKKVVDDLAAGLKALADGNLAHRIGTSFGPELDSLRSDFNEALDKLNGAMLVVGTNAHAITAAANEIRASSDDLSRRTEQQAASVEETAAALEEITTTVKDGAKRADETRRLVTAAGEDARNSGSVVQAAVDAMREIEKSSGEISNIIGVIDEIAFQTNLLALNAGVEAARAGEAGKGFAVVAQEVRELAQRSAKAAKEIKALITTSTDQVATGVVLVGNTGRALESIAGQVGQITDHIQAMAEAYREQSTGLGEINTAVNRMDQNTQQNASMVEEATAVAHTLAGDAESLTALLKQFRLAGDQQIASAGAHGAAMRHGRAA